MAWIRSICWQLSRAIGYKLNVGSLCEHSLDRSVTFSGSVKWEHLYGHLLWILLHHCRKPLNSILKILHPDIYWASGKNIGCPLCVWPVSFEQDYFILCNTSVDLTHGEFYLLFSHNSKIISGVTVSPVSHGIRERLLQWCLPHLLIPHMKRWVETGVVHVVSYVCVGWMSVLVYRGQGQGFSCKKDVLCWRAHQTLVKHLFSCKHTSFPRKIKKSQLLYTAGWKYYVMHDMKSGKRA